MDRVVIVADSPDPALAGLSDLDLLVEHALADMDSWGYGSYRHEHRDRRRAFRDRVRRVETEAYRRGLMTASGVLTRRGELLGHTADPRVAEKEEDLRRYWRARMRGGCRHVSPYGEVYP